MEEKKKGQAFTTLQLVMCALFAALTTVCSQISIPLPTNIPITLQTFAVAICGYLLGKKFGAVSLGVYAILGAVGVPVFASFSGGLSVIVGYTGGYILGFIPMAFLCGLAAEKKKNIVLLIVFSLLGLAVCHIWGTIQFAIVANYTLANAFLVASAPYLIKDIASMIFAYFISIAVLKAVKKTSLV